jgi:all-trans-8'-apo-beta-carotenal 15,15'-oxygenase
MTTAVHGAGGHAAHEAHAAHATHERHDAHADWARAFQNLPREHALEPLRVEGTIPAELDGVLYRNGPGRVDVAGERYGHWFDCDGAVTAVRLHGGRASGGVKLVRTRPLARQERAGRRLFGGYNTPLRRPVRELLLGDGRNPANTSTMLWQHRLFALCEAGYPFEIDRADLSTLGERDLGGVIGEAFSAHPHAVPARGALYGFGLSQGRRARITAYELPALGRARVVTELEIPGPTVMHDFAVTPRHLVFHVAPMRISLKKVLLGGLGFIDAMEWDEAKATELVVVPIDDPSSTFRVEVEAHMAEHFANAFERGGELCFDFVRYPDMRGLEDYVGGLVAGVVRAPLRSTFSRCTIDLATRRARFEARLVAPFELPRVSPRVEAAPHRFAWLAGYTSDEASRSGSFDAVLELDVERGAVTRFPMDRGCFCGEAVFVPRQGGAAENDGYLLTFVYDARVGETHLAVLDARKAGAPPLARAWFDHAIPPGFHGAWAPA